MDVTYDIALTQDENGELWLHLATCQIARMEAAKGRPVATLLGCEALPTDIKKCECMQELGE